MSVDATTTTPEPGSDRTTGRQETSAPTPEGDGSREDLIESGMSRADALRVADLVDRAEYKRRQAPPGVKITTKAFGRDRRLPITNGFRG